MRFLNYLKELFKKDSLRNLSKKADRLSKKNKIQYLVVPLNKEGKLMCVPGYKFLESYNKTAKKHGLRKLNYPQLQKISLYKTVI